MLCYVEHHNTWVPHGHNIYGILYVVSTTKQHKVNNSCIGLPLGVPFIKVLGYRKEQICNVGVILLLSFSTMASTIDNVKHNRLAIYSGAQNINQWRCHDGGPIPKEADPINSGIGCQQFETIFKAIIIDLVD